MHTSWQGRRKTAGMQRWSTVLHDTDENKKRTVILTRNLWNYKTTGIRQSPSVQIMKVHCMGVQFNITEGCPAIISTIIPGFQPTKKKKEKDILNKKCRCLTNLMCHDMEWMTQARLHVLWSYTESRQLTGEDRDIKFGKLHWQKTKIKLKTSLKKWIVLRCLWTQQFL